MARGGSRPGAGRKVGSPNKVRIPAHQKAKEIAHRALNDGENTPLEIMLEAARFFVTEARRLRALPGKREIIVNEPAVEGGKPSVKITTAHELYNDAAECARRAADFVHPRLSATEQLTPMEEARRAFELAVLANTLREAEVWAEEQTAVEASPEVHAPSGGECMYRPL